MKKNRIVCLSITLLIAFSLISCSADINEKKENVNVTELDTVDPAGNETVFLRITSENLSSFDKLKGEFSDANEYGVCCNPSIETIEELKNQTLINPINNQNLEYSYSRCTYKNGETKEYGTFYSVYDFYKDEDTQIGVLRGTDLICFYSFHEGNVETQFTGEGEEIRSIADEFLISVVGSDILGTFDIVSIYPDTSGTISYAVNYTKLTQGHKTDEQMTVFIGKTGVVTGYNGYDLCKYDTLKEKFDDDMIESAKAALESKINSLNLTNLKISDPIITTDVEGSLYVMINFSYVDDTGMACGDTVLVGVN